MAYIPSNEYKPEMGGFFKRLFKPPKWVRKLKPLKIATLPIRAAVSTAVSVASPKLAHEITSEISKKDFEHIGKVGDVGLAIAAAVVAAPVVIGAVSTAGGAIGSAAASLGGSLGLTGGTGLLSKLGPLGSKILGKVLGGGTPPAYQDLSPAEQSSVSPGDYSAAVNEAQSQAVAASGVKQSGGNPYLGMDEATLAAAKAQVENQIAQRQSMGLGGYADMDLTRLIKEKALIMEAYTPLLIKKYGLWAAGGLGAVLLIMLVSGRKTESPRYVIMGPSRI
jgi:hypothetical protein